MKSFLIAAALGSFLILTLFAGGGCANMVPPQGGPRDSLPPVLLDANPDDSTLNFRGNRITLNFDEYIDLQEVQNNLLFTPTLPTTPDVQVRLKTITIRLRDTLDPNTTYIFNFGNAIKDYNEGNVLRNFVYTFSTGPALDSLEFTGRVVMAETGTVDTTLTVILHKSLDDSAVIKERPRYVSRLDGSGNFRFRNLPAGTFAVYALGDAGLQRRYQRTAAFAFLDSPIVVRSGVAPVQLNAYKEAAAPAASATGATARTNRAAGEPARLRFTTSVSGGMPQDLLTDLVMTFETPLRSFDSTNLSLTTDSSFQPVQYTARLDSTRKIITLKTAWIENSRYNLITNRDFAEDTLGQRLLKSDTLTFNTRARTDYGNVILRLKNLDTSGNPVLQFVQNGTVVSAAPVRSGLYTQPLFLPGDYEMRLLYDRNNNGVWDPGQFFGTRRQPEIVRPISRRITVKPNWDNDFEIEL